jgi:hypothetical protein
MGTVLLVVVLVGAGIAGFFALLGRLSKSLLDRKSQALVAGLTAAGATLKATKRGGLYEGDDVALALDGREFLVNANYVSRSLVRANLLTKADVLPWAVFAKEKELHRLGKSLGINREVQTGDAAFDHQCYVDSPESDEVLKRLLADAATRATILELLALDFHVQTSSHGVEAFRLVPVHASLADAKAADAARHLATLAGSLPKLDGLELKPPTSVRNVPLLMLVLLFTAVGAIGAYQLDAALGVTLNRVGAMALAVGGGLVLWAAVVALLSVVARGSSHGMQALVVSAAVTLLGVPAFGGMLALTLNQRLDGAAAAHEVKVLAKETASNHRHTLEVESWEPGAASLRVAASCSAFEPLAVGNLVTVKVHGGALGLRWVERLDADVPWNL